MYTHSRSDRQFNGPIILRLCLLILVVLGASVAGGGRVARADGGDPVNIDGKTLGVDIRYFDGSSNAMVQKQIPSAFLGQNVPKADQPWLTDPLNQNFDKIWNADKTAGETLALTVCNLGIQKITSLVAKQELTAYGFNCAMDSTGTLSAEVSADQLSLVYQLPLNAISFNTTSAPCGGGFIAGITGGLSCLATAGSSDPSFTILFDLKVVVATPIPSTPCQLTPTAVAYGENASINGNDFQATAAMTFDPSDFNRAVSAIDSQQLTIGLSSLQSTLNGLENTCRSAAKDNFSKFDITVDSTNGLTFWLIHPEDAKPELAETTHVPDLGTPTIGLTQPEIQAGGQLTVKGSSFSAPPSTVVGIWWNDTFAGTFTESDIQWVKGGTPMPSVTKARSPFDNGAFWNTPALTPGIDNQFEVRDCFPVQDMGFTLLTICTPYSNTLDVKAGAGGSNAVEVYLDSLGSANQIGSGSLGTDGTFSSAITIPAGTATGAHTLYAQVQSSGQQAQADLTVAGAKATLTPTI
jgi:hypothetical protein